MQFRCPACDCLLTLHAVDLNLATEELRPVWQVHYHCPHCNERGRYPEFYSPEEAQACVQRQAELLQTPEAAAEIAQWDAEQERRVQQDAQQFIALVNARFPQWESHLHHHDPTKTDGVYLTYSLNPATPEIRLGMQAQLFRRELLLLCAGWHEHFEWHYNHDYIPAAVQRIIEIVEERYQVTSFLTAGRCYWSILQHPGEQPTWTGTGDEADTIEVMSWQGTYQRQLTRPEGAS
jgi:hypothetical protein